MLYGTIDELAKVQSKISSYKPNNSIFQIPSSATRSPGIIGKLKKISCIGAA